MNNVDYRQNDVHVDYWRLFAQQITQLTALITGCALVEHAAVTRVAKDLTAKMMAKNSESHPNPAAPGKIIDLLRYKTYEPLNGELPV